MFVARSQVKNEACLVETTPTDESISTQLRSRGCHVIQHVKENRLFLWYGSKCTISLRKSATVAAKMLKNRYNYRLHGAVAQVLPGGHTDPTTGVGLA